MKTDITELYDEICRHDPFWLKSDNNNESFHVNTTHVFPRVAEECLKKITLNSETHFSS